MTELDKKTKSLNQSGAFLQLYILDQLDLRKWETLVETPVIVAPFNKKPETHPLLAEQLAIERKIQADKFPQAVIESQNQMMKEETSVDIDAEKVIELKDKSNNIIFRLCIEVKKNDPKYSDWCFFQHKIKSEPMRVITKTIKRTGRTDLFHVPPTDRYGNEISVQVNFFNQLSFLVDYVSDFALALHNEEVKGDYYRSEKTKVDEAARQIIKGTYGLIIDAVLNQVSTGKGYDHSPVIFIPIIITNANLYLCDVDPYFIDSKTGHIQQDPRYLAVDKIIYEYPTPKAVQFPEPLQSNLPTELKNHVLKWQVLIMSPEGFTKFLNDINRIQTFD